MPSVELASNLRGKTAQAHKLIIDEGRTKQARLMAIVVTK
jgi:hypothetical protein